MSPLYVERVERGLIVYVGILAHPRVIAFLFNELTPGERGRFVKWLWAGPIRGEARVPMSRSYKGSDIE